MFYFYVLRSSKDNKLYFGSTKDLRRRLSEHERGSVPSTKNRRPIVLVYYEAYRSKIDAIHREKQMKNYGKVWSQLKRRIEKSIHEI